MELLISDFLSPCLPIYVYSYPEVKEFQLEFHDRNIFTRANYSTVRQCVAVLKYTNV